MKANFCTAKKAGKKPNPAKQSFAQLSKKLDKLEKTLKKASHQSKKCHRDNSDSNSKYEIGSGSTRKLGLNLEKAIRRSKFTSPSLIKATPSELARDSNIVSNQKIAAIRTSLVQQHLAIQQSLTIPRDLAIQQPLAIQGSFAILQDLVIR